MLSRARIIKPHSSDTKDQEIADFVGDVLGKIPRLEDALRSLLLCVPYGISVEEIMWRQKTAGGDNRTRLHEYRPVMERSF